MPKIPSESMYLTPKNIHNDSLSENNEHSRAENGYSDLRSSWKPRLDA